MKRVTALKVEEGERRSKGIWSGRMVKRGDE